MQILLALHHVHTHLILHRDLKTQNILLDKHRMVVKIGDFGISKILSSKSKAYTVLRCAGDPGVLIDEACLTFLLLLLPSVLASMVLKRKPQGLL